MSKNKVTKHHWRIYLDADDCIESSSVSLCDDEAHYVRNVLRLNEHDVIEIFDGRGLLGEGRIEMVNKKSVQIFIESIKKEPEPSQKVFILCGHPKPSNLADVVAAACETGATELVLFSSDFSKNSVTNEPRLKKIARESLRISKWLWETKIQSFRNLQDAWNYCTKQNQPSFFWCDELLDLNIQSQVPTLAEALKNKSTVSTVIVVGPEAGFSASERSFLEKERVEAVSLGPCILRVPVAVNAAVTTFYQNI